MLLQYPVFARPKFHSEDAMSTAVATEVPFISFLNQLQPQDWTTAIQKLLPSIHEVDKNATQIWFSFFPLTLHQALSAAEDPELLARELLLQGDYKLSDQIDSSHQFLYGHRYWPQVKQAIQQRAAESTSVTNSLADQIVDIASAAAKAAKVDESLTIGITAVGLMTLRQVGLSAFCGAPGRISIDAQHARKTPDQVLRARAKDDSQGLLGFLKTVDKKWTVVFDENDNSAKYKLNNLQDLAWGAADDKSRNWVEIDPRRIEGPIPVECRSASCGTCWVGVLGGAEKLAAVARLEGKRIKEFGYIETDEPKPLIRLACQAQVSGAVSIVIPPWNGVFGKHLRARETTGREDTPKETA